MQFLFPSFLWALGALAIPVLIHLFYFRRFKKVYFTNVKFLKEVKEETNSRRKIKNFLVLLMRLLAFAAIVFAFAQPFIPQDRDVKTGQRAVSVFIDNSNSMNSLSADVPLINQAKQKAREIISGFKVDDRFQILTNDFEGKHQRLMSQEDALSMIDEIKSSPTVRSISQVLSRQQQALNSGTADIQSAYLLSDFQKNITDLTNFSDTTLEVNLAPLQSIQEKNISIDSAWFDAPIQMVSQTNQLVVRLRNHSDEIAENVRLTIEEDGQIKPIGTIKIPARSSVTDTINLTVLKTGWHQATLEITDYPVQFDDKYFFTYKVAEKIKVLSIQNGSVNNYLKAGYQGLPYFELTSQRTNQLDYSSFGDFKLIILDDLSSVSSGLENELSQYLANGGNILIFPSATANIQQYSRFLTELGINTLQNFDKTPKQVADVNTEEFIFRDVFERQNANISLPNAKASYKLSNLSGRGEERIMTFRDGSTFLGKYKKGKGHVFLCSAPLNSDYNDLSRNGEIFIPLLYKSAIIGGQDTRIAYTIGKDDQIVTENRISEGELVYKLSGAQGAFIPEQQVIGNSVLLGLGNEMDQAGFYNLQLENEKELGVFGFNLDRRESNLSYFNTTDLAEQLGPNMRILENVSRADLSQLVGTQSQGLTLWRWCIILALIFLGLESLLIRVLKD